MSADNELVYFKMCMLQAEIEMNAMLAENKQCEFKKKPMKYLHEDFISLIEKYGIHTNAFPIG